MRIDIVTLFPAMVEPALATSMLGRARSRGLVDIRVVNLRDYATGKHRVTDDYQFGGGGGMVLKPEPIAAAVEALRGERSRVILMDPRGQTFTQAVAAELARETHLILVAGRYEGVDERVSEMIADERLSIGDYVLTGGELPALVVTDAVARLLPGVLGGEGAAERESFAAGLLEPPQYTRPEEGAGGAAVRRPRARGALAAGAGPVADVAAAPRAPRGGESDGRGAAVDRAVRARRGAGGARANREGRRSWTRFASLRRRSSRRTGRDSSRATRSACT